MFQKQTPVAPSVGLGIGSVTTPDENAKALKGMFQPTVSLNMPTQMLQQPVQSFQEGGIATPLVAQYDWRNRRYQNPPSYAARSAAVEEATPADAFRSYDIDQEEAQSLTPEARRALERPQGTLVPTGGFYTPGGPGLPQSEARRRALEQLAQVPAGPPREAYEPDIRRTYREEVKAAAPAAPSRSGIATVDLSSGMGGGETYSADPARSIMSQIKREEAPPEAPKPPAREKGALELTLDGIKEERARSAEDKKQNALLALMQAGFAMAAGRSPNALSNIGAGGQAGIAAFASLEKARREEQAALRRDELSIRLAQAKLLEDPEAVKTFKVLGGGDVMKGFELYNSDKKLQAATTIAKDITAPEEDRRAAAEYIRGQLMKARGGGSFTGFSATPVK